MEYFEGGKRMKKVLLKIGGMSCAGCSSGLEKRGKNGKSIF